MSWDGNILAKKQKKPGKALVKYLMKTGKDLSKALFATDPHYGARTVLLVGPQGTGKTTGMIDGAIRFAKKGVVTVWREIDLAQFNRIEATGMPVKVFAHQDDEIKILAIPHGSMKGHPYDVEISRYSTAADLYRQLEKGVVNVVFEPSYYIPSYDFLIDVFTTKSITKSKLKNSRNFPSSAFWIEFNFVLSNRTDRQWIAMFLDEIDDIYPATPIGLTWTLIEWGKDQVKHLRKSFVSTWGATQSYANVNWDVSSKFQDLILMKGATKPKRRSHVKESWLKDEWFKENVYKLSKKRGTKGWAFIESDAKVGLIQFEALPRVRESLQVIRKLPEGTPRPSLLEIFEAYGLIE